MFEPWNEQLPTMTIRDAEEEQNDCVTPQQQSDVIMEALVRLVEISSTVWN